MTAPKKIRPVLDSAAMDSEIHRMAKAIVDRNGGVGNLGIIGMQRRGVVIARRLLAILEKESGKKVPLGVLDVSFYRDDFRQRHKQPQVQVTDIPFKLNGLRIVLVDDVLYTGRTVRAALDSIMDFGRPANIQLAVLIDRGGRELPVQADYKAKTETTGPHEEIAVCVREIDGEEGVWVVEGK
jgi:pyrimidine operon attenuation protein / uracil phosphoribosyltransferase